MNSCWKCGLVPRFGDKFECRIAPCGFLVDPNGVHYPLHATAPELEAVRKSSNTPHPLWAIHAMRGFKTPDEAALHALSEAPAGDFAIKKTPENDWEWYWPWSPHHPEARKS